jgi:propionyl-CoA synthetase
MGAYAEQFRRSISDPEGFWADAAGLIQWERPPERSSAPTIKGQRPVGFVALKAGAVADEAELERELVQMIRDQVGPVAFFKEVRVVSKLPKTRSGKILRGTMRAIADGNPYEAPSTIEDPAALDEVERSLAGRS